MRSVRKVLLFSLVVINGEDSLETPLEKTPESDFDSRYQGEEGGLESLESSVSGQNTKDDLGGEIAKKSSDPSLISALVFFCFLVFMTYIIILVVQSLYTTMVRIHEIFVARQYASEQESSESEVSISSMTFEVTPEFKAKLEKLRCTICLEYYKTKEMACSLQCEHMYHEKCIRTWLKKNKCCPICIQHYKKGKDLRSDTKVISSSGGSGEVEKCRFELEPAKNEGLCSKCSLYERCKKCERGNTFEDVGKTLCRESSANKESNEEKCEKIFQKIREKIFSERHEECLMNPDQKKKIPLGENGEIKAKKSVNMNAGKEMEEQDKKFPPKEDKKSNGL